MIYSARFGASLTITSGDRDRILDYLESTYPPPQYVDRKGWETYFDTFLPIYLDAVRNKGYEPYQPGKSDTLVRYMIDRTGTRGGYPTAFMYALYTLAERGQIETYLWNPELFDTVTENRPQGWFESTLSNIGTQAGAAASSTLNKVLLTAGIVGVVYLLGKDMITKGIRKIAA